MSLEYFRILGTEEGSGCVVEDWANDVVLAALQEQVEMNRVVRRPLVPAAEPYDLTPPGSPKRYSVLANTDGTGELTIGRADDPGDIFGWTRIFLGALPWQTLHHREEYGYRLYGLVRHVPTSPTHLNFLAVFVPLETPEL